MRIGAAVASWGLAVLLAQAALAGDIGRAVEQLEQRIELQLRGGSIAPPADSPERTHEEAIEPWELVSV
jgi:hypothetical protein